MPVAATLSSKRKTVKKPKRSDIQLIAHTQLKPSKLNPRRTFDETKAEELAASIKAKGVLQNLVARKMGESFEIAAGERRWRAVDVLVKRGELPEDYALPVRVQPLTNLELVELATTENAARDDMHPLDEAAAFTTMLELGSDPESIALKMGMSLKTVKQRLALASLTDEAQDALRAGEMSLALAQALTSANPETQRHVATEIGQGYDWSPRDVARILGERNMKLSDALFGLEQYKGEISQNLFQEEEDAYFLDSEQAKRLQLEAMQAKAEALREDHAWVDAVRSSELQTSEYYREGGGDPGVLLVFDEESGEVNTYEPAYRRDPEPQKDNTPPTAGTKAGEAKPKLPKASYTKRLLVEARVRKTQALQDELVGQFRPCLILCIMGLLGVSEVKLKPEDGDAAHRKAESSNARAVFEGHQETLSALSSYVSLSNDTYPLRVSSYGTDAAEVYGYLKVQSDEQLHALFTALVAVRVGSWVGYDVDLGDDALTVQLARDLHLDMQRHFTLDRKHLELYRKAQLADIARSVGVPFDVSGMKTDSISSVILERARAETYLPPVMTFFPSGEKPPEPTLADTLAEPSLKAA